MTAETPGPASGSAGGLDNEAYVRLNESPEFQRLRHAFRRFVFPMTAAFLAWYLLYVVLSAYARGFMGTKVVGEINVALIFGLLQFVSTFLIAWAYERYASKKLEPLAAAVVAEAPSVEAAVEAEESGESEAAEAPAPAAEEPPAEEPEAEESPAAEAAETTEEESPAEESAEGEKSTAAEAETPEAEGGKPAAPESEASESEASDADKPSAGKPDGDAPKGEETK
ncbi:DUF485 domain-containing protein [Actinomadura barringtoniae]|uniref:DUF485 domain-containing protein n=1 Tax=Actinomadura barringtoniae TaxID=1427535 RepID=UPI0027DCBC8D|nr:DUF485 domain-containing protein [Actinomadura barringtoniae]